MTAAAEYPFPPEWPGPPDRPDRRARPGQPGEPGPPGQPEPGEPRWPGRPDPSPGTPQRPYRPPGPQPSPLMAPGHAWIDSGDWQGRLRERLLEQRVVMAHGHLDDTAATLLCAQLLTLDADSADRAAPIRLHLQSLTADLQAALTVMDAIDTIGVPLHALARGHIAGPALGVLAAAGRRITYPNAGFLLSEPETGFTGTATSLATRQRQLESMLDAFYFRLADVTGHEVDAIRDDARRGRFLNAHEAVAYGLVQQVAN